MPKGTPDLCGYVGAYFIGLEIKLPEGMKRKSVTTDAQSEWRKRAWRDGAASFVVSSVSEALDLIGNLRLGKI